MAVLPEKFMSRMKRDLGGRFGDYLAALERPPVKGLHINTLKCPVTVIDGAVSGLESLPFAENCRMVREGRPARHPYHAAGLYYMQEPSAMLPVAAAPVPAGARVLDISAAPGGKTSQLAIKLAGSGLLVSNEIDRGRAQILRENAVRMGYRNVVITNLRPGRVSEVFGGAFDVVLADAPCSGEGMMRKEEQAALNWSEANVRACAARQKEIILSADSCLKEGGLLVYSTCTFAEEEDEEIVKFALSLGYVIEDPPAAVAELGASAGFGHKFYPHTCGGEGQFFCLLRKCSAGKHELRLKKGYSRASASDVRLAAEILDVAGLDIAKKDDMLFVPALDFDLPCLMNGVMLGKLEKGRFVPAHQLFTALAERCRQRVELPLGDGRAAAYLAGEEIAGGGRGWCAVTVDGYALGGGKASGGVVKNHYPKHLRK